MKNLFVLAVALCGVACSYAREPVDWVNPEIGNISHLLVPTYPTVSRPNGMMRFADQRAVFELFRDGSFFEKVFAYLETGRQTGFADLRTATDALEEWVLARFTAKLGVFTAHDLYYGAFLKARGVVDAFTLETWVQYLDSAAIILAPDGSRRYALVRSRAGERLAG